MFHLIYICKLCMKHGESTDHLFLHCSLTMGLWHRLFQLAKTDWVPPRNISDMCFFFFFFFFLNSKVMTYNISVLIFFFLMIISIFWVLNYFIKLLIPLVNSIQSITLFEVHFYSEKIYKSKIMCKKNNSHNELFFIYKFFVLISLIFEFQIIFKNY